MNRPFLLLVLTTSISLAQGPGPNRPPDGVTAHQNLAYVDDGHERHLLDLYLPEKSAGPLPLLIWVHGGGWMNGSKDNCLPLRQGFAQRGFAVASINYRLSSHAIFPAQIEDCKAAIRWLRAHAKEYNLDPGRFGVWGSSAGGHLVALLGTSGDVKTFDTGANLDQSSRVQAVCDWYGPTDFAVFATTPGYERHGTDSSAEAKLLGGVVAEKKDQAAKASPLTYVTPGDPPFLIMHGDKDGTVPPNQSQLLFDALKKAGVSAHFHTIHGAGHGGPGFAGKEIEDMVAQFFQERLQKGSSTVEAKVTESTADVTASAPSDGPRPQIPWSMLSARADKNQDGKITREEFDGPPQLWLRLDRNGDGVLTREEHEKP